MTRHRTTYRTTGPIRANSGMWTTRDIPPDAVIESEADPKALAAAARAAYPMALAVVWHISHTERPSLRIAADVLLRCATVACRRCTIAGPVNDIGLCWGCTLDMEE